MQYPFDTKDCVAFSPSFVDHYMGFVLFLQTSTLMTFYILGKSFPGYLQWGWLVTLLGSPLAQGLALQKQEYRHMELETPYLAATDGAELLQDISHRFLFFKGDKNRTSSFVRLWIQWKLNGLNLPKLAKVLSSLLSGFRVQTPTKIFFTGSFFTAMAFLGLRLPTNNFPTSSSFLPQVLWSVWAPF